MVSKYLDEPLAKITREQIISPLVLMSFNISSSILFLSEEYLIRKIFPSLSASIPTTFDPQTTLTPFFFASFSRTLITLDDLSVVGNILPSGSTFNSKSRSANQDSVSQGPNLALNGPSSSFLPRG
jgi:hypothetical protein